MNNVKEKKEIKIKNTILKKILIYLPVLIIILVVAFLIISFITKKQKYTQTEYESRLSGFYYNLANGKTNELKDFISTDFENKENLLPLENNNYRLFSYNFVVFTNDIESNKIEGVKILYSILIQTKSSNISLLKEAYFSAKQKKIEIIKDIYVGKEITR